MCSVHYIFLLIKKKGKDKGDSVFVKGGFHGLNKRSNTKTK